MKDKKRALFALLVFGCLLILCGCAPGTPQQESEREEKILLTALFGESTADPGISDMLCEKIEAAFPQVELEWESVDWGERFSERLTAKIASGETPDLIIGKAQDVLAYQSIGALGTFPDSFAQLMTEQGRIASTVDGALYGLTYNQIYQGVLYNKEIFERCGVCVPETAAQMEAVCAQLRGQGITPFAAHFQETWYTGNILMQFALGEVFSHTPDWGDRLRAGEASFAADEAYRRCCGQVRFIYENTWDDTLSIAQSEADRRFAQGQAAMYLTGNWSVQSLQTIAPELSVGFFPYPNGEGDARLIVEPNATFMKSATTAHDALIDEIYRMILTDEEMAATLCTFAQNDSTLVGVKADTLSMIRGDIDRYRAQERLVSASVGNNQLVWAYQYQCAQLLLECLKGNAQLEDVLVRWDELRGESFFRE